MTRFDDTDLTERLLAWFGGQRRALPWRDAPCGRRDPYRVWLAEIMLQQTTVTAVIPYYQNFLDKWPNVKALAGALDDDVMRAWAGLGYYARARNLLACARFVADHCQGVFPRAESDLLKLPGIGPYTAAAVSAIAFNGPSAPVDGNVIRTLSRLYAVEGDMPKNKDKIQILAETLRPQNLSGDYAEALMDLGSQVCRPKNPRCSECPWMQACQAFRAGKAVDYPQKAEKKAKPTRRGWAFWVVRSDGHILLERRPPKGLLGGMIGLPTSAWGETLGTPKQAMERFAAEQWTALPGHIEHTFTHFHLELGVIDVRVDANTPWPGLWIARDDVVNQALPSVMQKAISHAQGIKR